MVCWQFFDSLFFTKYGTDYWYSTGVRCYWLSVLYWCAMVLIFCTVQVCDGTANLYYTGVQLYCLSVQIRCATVLLIWTVQVCDGSAHLKCTGVRWYCWFELYRCAMARTTVETGRTSQPAAHVSQDDFSLLILKCSASLYKKYLPSPGSVSSSCRLFGWSVGRPVLKKDRGEVTPLCS